MHKENIKKIIINKNRVEKELKFIRPPNRNKKRTRYPPNSYMAGVEGFEPSQAVLETDVLPLTLYP